METTPDHISNRSTARRPGTGKRRHPAHKSRVAALTLSVASSAMLSVGLFHADKAEAAIASAAPVTLKAGTYTGAPVTDKWGTVTVTIKVAGGKITSETTSLSGYTHSKSDRINARAVPVLKSETLTAQTASINNVSGATYTTNSYKSSLQSAIDKAHGATASATA